VHESFVIELTMLGYKYSGAGFVEIIPSLPGEHYKGKEQFNTSKMCTFDLVYDTLKKKKCHQLLLSKFHSNYLIVVVYST